MSVPVLLLALAVAAGQVDPAAGQANAAPLQVLKSPAFDRFAAAADAACPMRHLRYVTPGDLDLIEEDFAASLRRRERAKVAAADDGDARCAGRDGLSCPTTATLDAFAATGVLDRFAAFACTDKRSPIVSGAGPGGSTGR